MDQLTQFARLVFPVVSIRQGYFAFGDAFPIGEQGQFGVELGHMGLISWQVFFSINGIDRTFWNTDCAIDALIGVNGEEVGAFAEAVDRADIYTVGVFAADTRFRNNVGHDNLLRLVVEQAGLPERFGF